MDDFRAFYQLIDRLRLKGVTMKRMALAAGLPPSVLSSLYTTVLPAYAEACEALPAEEALGRALGRVNNVSKRRLLTALPEWSERLMQLEQTLGEESGSCSWATSWLEEVMLAGSRIEDIRGVYTSYSLSSSTDCLKREPFLIRPSEAGDGARVSRLNAYGEMQEGFGVRAEAQNFYCLLNETRFPHLMPVTVYLQIPFFHAPRQLRGMYIGLDYNRNPVCRRILLVKESEDAEAFGELPCGLIGKEALTSEQQAYYDYTCGPGDFIKMCTVPSLRMDETDLTKEKRMLAL